MYTFSMRWHYAGIRWKISFHNWRWLVGIQASCKLTGKFATRLSWKYIFKTSQKISVYHGRRSKPIKGKASHQAPSRQAGRSRVVTCDSHTLTSPRRGQAVRRRSRIRHVSARRAGNQKEGAWGSEIVSADAPIRSDGLWMDCGGSALTLWVVRVGGSQDSLAIEDVEWVKRGLSEGDSLNQSTMVHASIILFHSWLTKQ